MNEHRDLVELQARVLRVSALRAHLWRMGRTFEASVCTRELDVLWEHLRAARAMDATLGEPAAVPVDHPIDRFLAERTEPAESVATPIAELHSAYGEWARIEREDPITARGLASELRRRGFESHRTMSARCLAGLRVRMTETAGPGSASRTMRRAWGSSS